VTHFIRNWRRRHRGDTENRVWDLIVSGISGMPARKRRHEPVERNCPHPSVAKKLSQISSAKLRSGTADLSRGAICRRSTSDGEDDLVEKNESDDLLFVGLTYGRRQPRLYIGRGRLGNEPILWQETKPSSALTGKSDAELRRSAVERARKLFNSRLEFLDPARRLKTWFKVGKYPAHAESPTFLFEVDPWLGEDHDATAGSTSGEILPVEDTNPFFAFGRQRLRPKQQRFREQVFALHGVKCAFCSMRVIGLLEAAHIFPFARAAINKSINGLPLCLNHHGAFDLNIIQIDPETLELSVVEPLIAASLEVSVLSGSFAKLDRECLRRRNQLFQTLEKS
jgi:hypothetical protein